MAYRKHKKARKESFVLEFTANGETYQKEVKKKEAKKKNIFIKALINVMKKTRDKFGKEKAKFSMPPVEEVVQMNIGEKLYDIHVINFEDEDALKCFNDYERFVFTKSCKPKNYKNGKHRDSQCETLKGKGGIEM